MSWYVYVLQCADNSLYTGITKDVDRRIVEHNKDDKKGARYTRARRPVSVVYQETCENRAQASSREYQIKKLSRAQKLILLSNNQASDKRVNSRLIKNNPHQTKQR